MKHMQQLTRQSNKRRHYEEVDMMSCVSVCNVKLYVKSAPAPVDNVYGHTTLKAPVLVRSPKLSNVGPGWMGDRLGIPGAVDFLPLCDLFTQQPPTQ